MVRVASEDKYRNNNVPEQKLDTKIDHSVQEINQSNHRIGQNQTEAKSRTSSRRSMDNK